MPSMTACSRTVATTWGSSMSSSVTAVVRHDGSSQRSVSCFDDHMLSRLIAAAAAILDSDRATAKEYMLRAAELLRVSRGQARTASCAFSAPRGGLTGWQQQRLVAFVEANVGAKVRCGDLARVVQLSKAHFFRAFCKSFGVSPMAYVAKRRVVLSQALMGNSRASLSEIALACGMCDQAHFTRVFRRVVGVSPGVWRRQFASVRGEDLMGGPESSVWHIQNMPERRSVREPGARIAGMYKQSEYRSTKLGDGPSAVR